MPAPLLFTPGNNALAIPEFRPRQPRRGPLFGISGVTRDASGNALAGCSVKLYRTATDVEVDVTTSDGSGAYSFPNVTAQDGYYVVAYLPGSPDVAGTTVNTLLGVDAGA
jgi:hypothetical protein